MSSVASPKGERTEGTSTQTWKFAKDKEQPAHQPAISLDSNANFKFLLILKKKFFNFLKITNFS